MEQCTKRLERRPKYRQRQQQHKRKQRDFSEADDMSADRQRVKLLEQVSTLTPTIAKSENLSATATDENGIKFADPDGHSTPSTQHQQVITDDRDHTAQNRIGSPQLVSSHHQQQDEPSNKQKNNLDNDVEVLCNVYKQCGGPHWRKRVNWATKSSLHVWSGVKVGAAASVVGQLCRILELDLNNNNLHGKLPVCLQALTALRVLNLYDNSLTGQIPDQLCRLTNLQILRLDGNRLSGEIPSDIGRLVNLKWLRLSSNRLRGGIPASIGRLTQVHKLYLYRNNLTGTLPSTLGCMTQLRRLGLHSNGFTGDIPLALCHLTNLTRLWLTENNGLKLPNQAGSIEEAALSCYSKADVDIFLQMLMATGETGDPSNK